jgi:hypothetical protein
MGVQSVIALEGTENHSNKRLRVKEPVSISRRLTLPVLSWNTMLHGTQSFTYVF